MWKVFRALGAIRVAAIALIGVPGLAQAAPAADADAAPAASEPATVLPRDLQHPARLIGQGRAAEAIPLLEAAYLTRPGPAALRLLGDALERTGRLSYATEVLDWLRLLVPAGDERTALEARIDRLRHRARLRVRVVPDSAYVAVAPIGKGKPRPAAPSPLDLELTPGRYRLQVSAAGHVPRVVNVELPRAGDRALRLRLEPQTCPLHVTSDPPAAAVQLDGGPAEPAPRELRVGLGAHTVSFRQPGRVDRTDEISCVNGEAIELLGALSLPPRGRVRVQVPPGSVVVIDACGRDKAPGCQAPDPLTGDTAELSPGRHRLRVSRPGYFAREDEVLVQAGEEALYTLSGLTPILPPATSKPPPRSKGRVVLWTVLGVAGAAAVAGAATAAALVTAPPLATAPAFPSITLR